MAKSRRILEELEDDSMVKVAGVDVDGILRGKIMAKKKFASIVNDGFGFCSVIFGWDMHDQLYARELKVSNKENGYRDVIAVPDVKSFRRIPWEDNVPLFLVDFVDPDTQKPVCACSRSLLKTVLGRLQAQGMTAMAGAEYEFYHFRGPLPSRTNPVKTSSPNGLQPLTEGMFGYSLLRPVANQDYYYDIFKTAARFDCDIESWHTETGPGVFEAALKYGEAAEMADKACLFKYMAKAVGIKHGITPTFMAKPHEGMPGCSGHMHVSILDDQGANLLSRATPDASAPWPDAARLSDFGRHFLAGLLDGLPDVMPLVAPTVNSYKRLVENYWAPVTVSWGLEHRVASIRLIASDAAATRFEFRVPGADANPYLVLAAVLALGWRGVARKLPLRQPPLAKSEDVGGAGDCGVRLAKSLKEATAQFMRPDSVAREVFGDDFVEHYGGTREHEIRLWDETVTDWEIKRYLEAV